jgi:ABC-type transport system involved in multi-copper enzyme maturation permease subunit
MRNLLLKEWFVNRSTIIVAVILIPILGFIGSSGQAQATIYLAILIGCMYPLTSSMNENSNKSDILVNSLPVTRKEVVTAKYLFSILLGIILTLVIAAINLFIPSFEVNSLFELILSVSAIGLFSSLYYPLFYLLGPRFVMFGMAVFFVCFTAIFPIVINLGLKNGFWGLSSVYQQLPTILLAVVLLGITIIALFVTKLISVQIYRKKQF